MIAAIVSCMTGYLLSLSGSYEKDLVVWHMWMGISVASISILLYAKIKYRQFDISYKILLVALLLFILITGHLGGLLTPGSNYFTEGWSALPDSTLIPQKKIVSFQETNLFAEVIQPLLRLNFE